MSYLIQNKFQFKSPTTISIIGGTGSGKTRALFDIIKARSKLFEVPPKRIIYCYSAYQPIFDTYSDICEFREGILDFTELDSSIHNLIVLDDLLHDINAEVAKSFTVYSHHLNATVCFLSQVLFMQNKHARIITLNSHYILLFKIKRDLRSVRNFASQLFPGDINQFVNIYSRHTFDPFSYICLDLHPATRSRLNIHSGILPAQIETVYNYGG